MNQSIISAWVLLFLGVILVIILVRLIKNFLELPRKNSFTETHNPAYKEITALSKDPSQMKSYDPDWVLRYLLQLHPQFFAQREIKQVLASCVPHEKEVYDKDRFFSFNWYWIVELTPGHANERALRYAYVAGWFDPRLWEPTTHLQVWFFSSPNEALQCAVTPMKIGGRHTRPNKRLYEFLSKGLQDSE
jgi:hypothetical protein